jgi:hypothetical protein
MEHMDQSPSFVVVGVEIAGLCTGNGVGFFVGFLVGGFVATVFGHNPNWVVSDLWKEPPPATDIPFNIDEYFPAP